MKIIVEELNQRLDIFSSNHFSISRSKAQKFIEKGFIKVNNLLSKSSYKLNLGDCVEYNFVEEEFLIKPKNTPLNIVYEDDYLIVLNKQKGIICHPTSFMEEDTLVSALLYHTKGKLSDIGGNLRLGIVHRLDKNTSGLMLIAKTNEAHIKLQEDIQTKKTIRKYLAVCHGVILEDEGRINKPLVHYLGKTVKMNVSDNGQEAVTDFKVLERFNSATFVELTLQTGRTHQIRCHLAYLGHPVVGDSLYGAKAFQNGIFSRLKTKEQVLESYYLCFTHPISGEIMEFKIDHDLDLSKTLNLLRS